MGSESAGTGRYDFENRVALVTGSGRGIGLAVARRLAADGAAVVLVDRDGAVARETASEMCAEGHSAVGLECDVSRSESVDRMVARALEQFGRIDVLFNNAGVMGRAAPLWELSDRDWDEVMQVDLASMFYVCRAVVPHMRERGSGAIVNMASIAGKEGTPRLVPYSTAKAGIIAFTKALGKELIRDGVRVNCVAPAVIETPLLDQLPQESIDLMLSKAPMERFGTAEEVAAIVHFLASDDASFVTAQCFDASGGRATY
jgi:NAD(P)-dependent dehydrogenase (short-subunit alcohol dehydrogenase family)